MIASFSRSRQENLEADLGRIAARIGIDTALALPRAKGSTRSDRRPAKEILTAEQKAMICERHRRTFDPMGYEP